MLSSIETPKPHERAGHCGFNSPVDDLAELAGTVGSVRGNSEGVDFNGPRHTEDVGNVLLDSGLPGLPLVTDWRLSAVACPYAPYHSCGP